MNNENRQNMINPKFSIIIPNYNKGNLIKNCLNSVFNQTINKNEYEVIVVDDGSTDDSLKYINEYDVVLLKSNRLGAGGARNKGLDIAKGQYIILLDSDDFFADNNVLAKLKGTLNGEDIVFVRYIEDKLGQKRIIQENEENTLEELIYKSKYFCCTLKCFKNSLVNDIRYKERCAHEDISFVLELMCKAESMLYYKDNLYVYYKPNTNSTVDNYSIRKAIDFLDQTIEYFYLADKYPSKKDSMLRRVKLENYYKKIDKLYDWSKNSNLYTYKEYLE